MSFPYPLVLFDLDGTLVDSAADIAEAVNRTLDELGHPRQPEATVRAWIGLGTRVLLDSALRHAGSRHTVDEEMPRLMRHYGDCLLLNARLYRGTVDALDALAADGVTMTICTNKPERYVRPLLDAMGITRYFDGIVGGDTLPERKPHAMPLLHLVAMHGRQVEECLMVGDSEADAGAAHAAGMDLVLVRHGYPRDFDLEQAGAVAVLDDLATLPALSRP
ncbi:phosphoglycolate phosphatase [Luteimonas terricola]|jgi:phosphoglycolate phosphatase|uniref:Phosphoglycolate phosphatase n=1 Tax=Luteimonas terricola TaxID=645597 RepID=A0ABQ2EJ83_9GAMM|nr:phosphoglycolate phosphatase [Luteimonas terricola]GGK14214.1 phosphoglycolate phosphatase, bacterial [Luteimonas terricola]